jgi:hypothetical protein
MAKSLRSKSKRKFRAIRRDNIFDPAAQSRLARLLDKQDITVPSGADAIMTDDTPAQQTPKFSFTHLAIPKTQVQDQDSDQKTTSLDIIDEKTMDHDQGMEFVWSTCHFMLL